MSGSLNKNQIEYVLFHLEQQGKIDPEIKKYFNTKIISRINSADNDDPRIEFPLVSESLDEKKAATVREIPVLFSISGSAEIFHWEGDSVVFDHDFLRSAFYLLSGYQELNNKSVDKYNRFPHTESIQCRLGITETPVVNYYFDFIFEGIDAFCKKHKLEFTRSPVFEKPSFFLSHDIDIVDTYRLKDVLFRLKRLFFPADTGYPIKKRAYYLWKYTFNYFRFWNRPNPHWDFSYLLDAAERRKLKSTFFFLHREDGYNDSKYTFKEKRIRELFGNILDRGMEIGLHGSSRSTIKPELYKLHLRELENNSGTQVFGIRQHRLIYKTYETGLLQANAGFKYDATLGFAEHEGFRNSFCLPFKLYDFEKDEMIDIWQLPLTVMDATLTFYRELSYDDAVRSVDNMMDECKKFNGVFSLLWHNGNFDEEFYSYGRQLFERILDSSVERGFNSCNGSQWIEISEEAKK